MEASAELSKTVSSFYDKPEERGKPAVEMFRVEHELLRTSFDETLAPLFHRIVRGPVEEDIQADFNQIKELVNGRNDAYAELDSLMKLSKVLSSNCFLFPSARPAQRFKSPTATREIVVSTLYPI
uniref:Uncharacterized protein n=2 Tax=Rhodosorus marinus TaxID=101924 RepID=A0A7S3EMN4_9RHOD|mmetsp:Transcript_66/g.156  ORF Transcript_66/g.156 Transcript_66/m.156 type:complete len:125 (+) Transcript_66:428-802(+)